MPSDNGRTNSAAVATGGGREPNTASALSRNDRTIVPETPPLLAWKAPSPNAITFSQLRHISRERRRDVPAIGVGSVHSLVIKTVGTMSQLTRPLRPCFVWGACFT